MVCGRGGDVLDLFGTRSVGGCVRRDPALRYSASVCVCARVCVCVCGCDSGCVRSMYTGGSFL